MKYIIGNLKMNLLSQQELERYFKNLDNESAGKKFRNSNIILCPPFIHIKNFAEALKRKKVAIGAQDVFWEKSGSFTGEISPAMLKNIGAEYVIIGHSERRRYFGETDETVNLKIKAVLKERMAAIFCLGETIDERGSGMTSEVIIHQLEEGLKGISVSNLEKIIFVYEPVWAVGTDVTPTCNGIMEIRILIRKILAEKYGFKNSQKAAILYGGSVKPKVMNQVCIKAGMDGVLVGRESLDPHEFAKIVELLNC